MSEEQPPPSAAAAGQGPQQLAAEDNFAALFSRLRSQVEYYFSSQNLARDTYLRNALTAEHSDMPSPQPGEFMCPAGVITGFPKVRDICSQFGAGEPPALLLAKALEGSAVVTVSPDGNWVGPVMQQLPPLTEGVPPPRGPPPHPHFQQPLQHQQGYQQPPYAPNFQMMPPGGQQGAGGMPYQPGVPYPQQGQHPNPAMGPISPAGSDSPSSASIESMPSQQKPMQQVNLGDSVLVAVTNLPAEVNPIELLSAFSTETIRPKSAFIDGNTSTWFVAFKTEADAKAAMHASSERTLGGAPIRAVLNSEMGASSKVSVASASAASLSSMSAPGGPMMQQQMAFMGQPPGAYPLPPAPSPPPMQPYPPAAGGPPYGMPPPMPVPPGAPPYPPPYYNPQQMQHMYPGGYMPQQMPYPPPPMGPRYGAPGGMPPPMPRGYPGPPPPYPPYQGMPQYMGDGYGGPYHHGQQHNQQRPFNDRRPGSAGHAGGGFGKGKKKKNKNHQYQQQHRGSLGSGSLDNSSGPQHLRHDNSMSPGPGGKWKKKGDHGDQQFRRSHGHASPTFNRQQNRHRNDRLSSSDTTPSPQRKSKGGEKKDIFSSSDFPGLGGEGAGKGDDRSVKSSPQPASKPTINGEGSKQHLVGYASALLKTNEAEEKTKEEATAPAAPPDKDADSVARQAEMEKSILSEFHDLSMTEGEKGAPLSPDKKHHGSDDKTGGNTVGTASSSTIDAPSQPHHSLPILPGPIPGHDERPSRNFSSRGAAKEAGDEVAPLPDAGVEPSERTQSGDGDKSKPVAWGGKRFADVI